MLQAQNPRGLLVHTAPDEHVPHGTPPISLRSPKHHLQSSLGKSCTYLTHEHIHCATDSTIGYGEEYQEQYREAQPIPAAGKDDTFEADLLQDVFSIFYPRRVM